MFTGKKSADAQLSANIVLLKTCAAGNLSDDSIATLDNRGE